MPYFLNSQPKDAPTSPYRNPSFTTPRKDYDIDFSSGPESSPAVQPDVDTPDGKPLPPVPNDDGKSTKSNKRNSLFNFYGRFAPTSGKGEIKKPATDALAKRIYKKRRQAQTFGRQLALARVESEDTSISESDDPQTPPTKRRHKKTAKDLPPIPSQAIQQPQQQQQGMLASTISFIHAHPDAPSIIAKYVQVIFNCIILATCIFIIWSFIATIRADVDKASEDAYQEALAETVACQKHFIDNRCNAAARLPALEVSCAKWELCMSRDPNAVRRASLSVATFAEILNSFVEPISLKTMLFTVLVLGTALAVNNGAFLIFRRAEEKKLHEYQPPQYHMGMHSTGQTGQMGQFALTPGLPYGYQSLQQQQHYMLQEKNADHEYDSYVSPSKGRSRSRSPEKKKLMLEHP